MSCVRGLSVMEEMHRFLKHMRMQIACFLRPQAELTVGFSSASLDAVGFLPAVRECGSLLRAYRECRGAIAPTGEEDRVLSLLFSAIGGGYLEEELRLIDGYVAEFAALVEARRQEAPKRRRLIKTLCATATAGILILIA
jgi:hypothetical protein